MITPEIVLLLPIGILVIALGLRFITALFGSWWHSRRLRRAAERLFND